MSQWIKKSPILVIQLAVVILSGYFLVYRSSLLTGLIFIFLLFRLIRQYGLKTFKKIYPIILICLVLFFVHRIKTNLDQQNLPTNLSKIQMVPDSIRIKGDSLSFQGHSAGRKYQAFYKLKSQKDQAYFQQLDDLVVLTIQAEVNLPEETRNFNGFDYRDYLRTKEIYQIIKISEIQGIRASQTLNPMDWLSLGRRRALLHIASNFPAPMRHYMIGLLFGDLDTDFEEMKDIYSSLGIIHLFALSGMQVGYFIDKLRYILLRLGLKRETVDRIQIPFSIGYAAMTLAVCYFLMPHFLLTAGGVLSFAYAFLLSVFDFEDLSAVKRILVESLAISLGILPILIFYFYSFQPLSILLTFAFSILFDVVILPLLSVLFILSPFLAVTQVNFFFVWLERVITWIAERAAFPLVFGKPEPVILLALLIVLALIYDYFHRKKLVIGLSCLVFGLLFFTKQPLSNEVTIVDVGQGDSILLRDYKGKTVLIDVGGRVDFGTREEWQERRTEANASRTLLPYLKSQGIGKIDQLVLTHTDTDHVGDMEVLAQQMKVGEVLVSSGSLTDLAFVDRLKKMAVRVRVVQVGDQLSIMDSQLHVLYPLETGDGGNNDSLILYGKLLDRTFLFTGDLEEVGEEILMATYPNLPVDVLKAGHHGSKGSSSEVFLDQIQPELALLSIGKDNRYKHPHQETLDRLSERDIASLRTDLQGAIRFKGWKKWTVETVK